MMMSKIIDENNFSQAMDVKQVKIRYKFCSGSLIIFFSIKMYDIAVITKAIEKIWKYFWGTKKFTVIVPINKTMY